MTINPFILRPDLYARLLIARRRRRRQLRMRRDVEAAFVRSFKRHGRRTGVHLGKVFVAASASDTLYLSAEARALWMALGVLIECVVRGEEADRIQWAQTLAKEFRKRETLMFAESVQDRDRGIGQIAAAMPPGAVARTWHGAADNAAHRLFVCLAPAGAESPFITAEEPGADGAVTPETESE